MRTILIAIILVALSAVVTASLFPALVAAFPALERDERLGVATMVAVAIATVGLLAWAWSRRRRKS